MTRSDVERALKTPAAGSKTWQVLATIIATSAHFSSGYAVGFLSPAIPLIRKQHLPDLTEDQEGNLGSLMLLSGTLVSPLAAVLADSRIGRKGTCILTAIPFIVCFSLNILFPSSIVAHYCARFFVGISAGTLTIVCPLYISEISELSIRGSLNSLVVIMFNSGLFVAYLAGIWIHSFVLLSVLGLALILIFLTVCWFMPESPEFLLKHGHKEAAVRSLRRLRGAKIDLQEEMKYMEISRADNTEDDELSTWRKFVKVFGTPSLRKAIFIPMILMFFQQFAGIIAVISYTSSIFSMAGSTLDPNVAAAVIGLIQLVATFGTTAAVDRLGRRPLLLTSSIVTALSMATLALYFHLKANDVDLSSFGLVPLVALVGYICFFSLGLGPVPWVILGEIFTPDVKTLCTTIASMWVWGLCTIVAKIFPTLVAALGIHWVMWAFSLGCVLALVASCFTPETKGKSPSQIQEMLAPKRGRKG
ncbi:facilitated trehalose transporter Tret1-2 homolog [Neocloeon triangulifer]|uniref:facilitated trehalose transporter Tret1-2 homolog n=1 Tax=Neocloeon triangulifer TaxID=2078957 RepID=UPI00286EDD27|nr:facilitated trehalose transporter Tret1-2 homolog [Neocloeon triangulifer]